MNNEFGENRDTLLKYGMINCLATLKFNLENDTINVLYSNGVLSELDGKLNRENKDLTKLYELTDGIKLSSDIYETHNGDMVPLFFNNRKWVMVEIIIPEEYSSENPNIVLFLNKLPQRRESVLETQLVLEKIFVNSSLVNIANNEISIIKRSTLFSNQIIEKRMNYEKVVEYVIENIIYDDDKKLVSDFLKLDNLRDLVRSSVKEKSIYYRRKIGFEYRWVKCMITPSELYSEEKPEVMIITMNYNDDALKYLAIASRYEYQLMMERQNSGISESFYLDILKILNLLTEPYLAYITVDLKEDVYLSYKMGNIFHDPYIKATNHYSVVVENYVNNNFAPEVAKRLLKEVNINNIKKELSNKNTMNVSFEDTDHIPKIINIRKISSENGVPTKAIIKMSKDYNNDKLLKIKTFGNFEVIGYDNKAIKFEKRQSKEVLAYLIDNKGYPITINDIIVDVLEKDIQDVNAKKYASTLIRKGIRDLEEAGYTNIIIAENRAYRINVDAVNCDYYRLLDGDVDCWSRYNNEYMKEYSWAEETNAEIQHLSEE